MNIRGIRWKKEVVIILLWIIGLWALGHILEITDSRYPMLNEYTINDDYDEKLVDFIQTLGLFWTFNCIALGYLWTRPLKKD